MWVRILIRLEGTCDKRMTNGAGASGLRVQLPSCATPLPEGGLGIEEMAGFGPAWPAGGLPVGVAGDRPEPLPFVLRLGTTESRRLSAFWLKHLIMIAE